MQTLDGLTVLEVGPNLAAHYAGRLLADVGAAVTKVEPVGGDPSRRRGPFVGDAPSLEGSALFLYVNLNKRGITLDRATPTGREILGRLVMRADVVLWGDEPSAGRALFESLDGWRGRIWMLVSNFGAGGPHSSWTAHGINLFHLGGEGYLMPGGVTYRAYPDREPIKAPGHLAEFSAGTAVACGLMVGLAMLDDDSDPLLVDTSVQESLLQLVIPEISQFADQGSLADRTGRSLWIGGLMPTADGWAEVMPLEQRMWKGLVALMGNPEWTAPFHDEPARRSASDEIMERLAEWTRQVPGETLYQEGQRLGVPVGPAYGVDAVLASPQLTAREFFVEVEHPYAGRIKYPALPFRFTPPDPHTYRPAPLLGQHNQEVIVGDLGFSRRELDALFEAGIV